MQKSPEGQAWAASKEIDDLIEAFDRVMHEDHLNLDRASCPGTPALTVLAKDSKQQVPIPCLSIFDIARLAWMS